MVVFYEQHLLTDYPTGEFGPLALIYFLMLFFGPFIGWHTQREVAVAVFGLRSG